MIVVYNQSEKIRYTNLQSKYKIIIGTVAKRIR
jgi:hypothetical protein